MIPLRYKDRREEGETALRQCQLVQLHLLHVFDRICRENNLIYCLSGGTLIGALRHNGFIPWDDDLDVAMPMKDFKKFLKMAPKILPQDVTLQKPGDEPRSGYRFAKLRDAYSFFYEPHVRVPTIAPSGIYLDIFPYEDCPAIPESFRRKIRWLTSAFYEHQLKNLFKMTECPILLGWWFYCKALCCSIAHLLLRGFWHFLQLVLPCRNVCFLLDFWEAKLNIPKAWLNDMPTHRFEDGDFPVPHHADEALQQRYGDWRTPLPPDQRQGHVAFIDPFRSAHPVEGLDIV